METRVIYMTAGSTEEATTIGRELVSQRLVACVNVIPKMNSLYWWDGEIQEDEEAILIAKTKETLVQEVVAAVKSLHSYECPCVVSLVISGGNPEFLEWIGAETRQGKSGG